MFSVEQKVTAVVGNVGARFFKSQRMKLDILGFEPPTPPKMVGMWGGGDGWNDESLMVVVVVVVKRKQARNCSM